MSTALAFATRRVVLIGTVLVASALATGACGGQAVEDESGTGGALGSGGSIDGAGGGHEETGGVPESGGAAGSGGSGAGGMGGLDNGCNLETVECPDGSSTCECPGVFDECPFGSVHCDADANGQPRNCTCGEPSPVVEDCDYSLQYRCGSPEDVHIWTAICTCDPVFPTDEEPCRYFQNMYDAAGLNRVCTMAVADIEPEEKYKYHCSCVPAD